MTKDLLSIKANKEFLSVMIPRSVKKASLFIILVILISYGFVGAYLALGGQWVMPMSTIISALYMLIPMVIAVSIQKLVYKQSVIEPLGVSFHFNIWFIIAWLMPVILVFFTLGISLLFPFIEYSPEMSGFFDQLPGSYSAEQIREIEIAIETLPVHYFWISLVGGLIAGVTINALFAFGEELGWRGFLLKELSFLGFWKSSIVIGVVWGIWHAPMILQGHNYPDHRIFGVLMMIIFCLLLSPILGYITLKAKSVLAASICHGTINALAGLTFMVVEGGNDLTVGATGLPGIIALCLINVGIFLFDRVGANPSLFAKTSVGRRKNI